MNESVSELRFMSHQQLGHMETGPRFQFSSERPEKRAINLAIPGLVVQHVIHYTTAAPKNLNLEIADIDTVCRVVSFGCFRKNISVTNN